MPDTGDEFCPVQSFERYINFLHPKCNRLFQYPKTSFLNDDTCWYQNKPIGLHCLRNFMPTLSRLCQLSDNYTNHCIRATGATILAENSFGVADIMSVTGHKSVSSLAIYQRTSQNRKLEMADALAAASGKSQQLVPVKQKAPRSSATASATATSFTAAVTASVTTTTPVATVARNPNILSEEEVSLMFEEFSEDSPASKPPALFEQCSMQGCTFNITIHPK
ncbi:hypothetical protein V1264_016984 [Littorina saxatilis]|uniref:Tyr recombinase domain-containing protein n=2 Tax=Littorina saxatilis TaxID=31220 RepID=A0AAN9BLR0_9CAEN